MGSDEGKEEGKYENSTAPYQPGTDEEGKQGECVFTVDCLTKVKRCKEKSCRCVFGKCHHHDIEQFPRDKHQDDECDTYKDCECKSDPENCFCQGYKSNKKCLNEAWECHQDPAKNLSMAIPWKKIFQESPVECAALEKCKGKKCSCHFLNTCENECDNPEDCKRKYSYMSTPPGHHWKCDWGICQEIKKENNGSKEEKYEGKEEEKYEGKEEKKYDGKDGEKNEGKGEEKYEGKEEKKYDAKDGEKNEGKGEEKYEGKEEDKYENGTALYQPGKEEEKKKSVPHLTNLVKKKRN